MTFIRRLFARLLHRHWTVNDYGAVGDGVTDDTEAIQKALNAGCLKFHTGKYHITRVLNLR